MSVPGDPVYLFARLQGAVIPWPPFGTLQLDPSSIVLVDAQTCGLGHDPIAYLRVPILDDPRVAGLSLHLQTINVGTRAPQALLSPSVVGVIVDRRTAGLRPRVSRRRPSESRRAVSEFRTSASPRIAR
ncbi:MAG: hypothetical protein R3F56_21195 [Planctomycetota bacterium]